MSWVCRHGIAHGCEVCNVGMAAAIEREDRIDIRNRPCTCRPSDRLLDLDGRCGACHGRIYDQPNLGERAS